MHSNFACSSCFQVKELDEFYTHSNDKPRLQCKECVLTRRAKPSRESSRKRQAAYRERNYDKCLAATIAWRKRNLDYDKYRAATYRARKLNQTPTWSDLDKIKEIYHNCPDGYHVDHIVPLKGKQVSGLHVSWNLQYLPAKDNLAKRNLYAA